MEIESLLLDDIFTLNMLTVDPTLLKKKSGLFSPDCSVPFEYISNQVANETWSICYKIMPAFHE